MGTTSNCRWRFNFPGCLYICTRSHYGIIMIESIDYVIYRAGKYDATPIPTRRRAAGRLSQILTPKFFTLGSASTFALHRRLRPVASSVCRVVGVNGASADVSDFAVRAESNRSMDVGLGLSRLLPGSSSDTGLVGPELLASPDSPACPYTLPDAVLLRHVKGACLYGLVRDR